MKLNEMEQMAMDFFDDGNFEMTIQRLCLAATLSPNPKAKKLFCGLALKLSQLYNQKTE